jgi:hypothetical protein
MSEIDASLAPPAGSPHRGNRARCSLKTMPDWRRGLLSLVALAAGCDLVSGLADFEVREVPPATGGSGGMGGGGAGGHAGDSGGGGQGGEEPLPTCPTTVDWVVPWDSGGDQTIRGAVEISGGYVVVGLANGTIDFGSGAEATTQGDVWTARVSAAGVQEFGRRIDGVGSDIAQHIVRSGSGAALVGDHDDLLTFGGSDLYPQEKDAFVGFLDGDGEPEGGFDVAVSGLEQGHGLAVDADRFYVIGRFDGDDPLLAGLVADGVDAYVIAVDEVGTVLWEHLFSGPDGVEGQEAHGIALAGGAVYVTGAFASSIASPEDALSPRMSAGARDLWVAKIEATTGELMWLETFGSIGDDLGEWIAMGSEGPVIVGHFSGPLQVGDITYNPASGQTNGFALGLDPDGEPRFFTTFASESTSSARGVAIDGNGRALVTGLYQGALHAGSLDAAAGIAEDGFVARLARYTGEVECLFTFGGADLDRALFALPAGDGVVIGADYTRAPILGKDKLVDGDGLGAVLFKMSPPPR